MIYTIAGLAFTFIVYHLQDHPERCGMQIERAVKSIQDLKVIDLLLREYLSKEGDLPNSLENLESQAGDSIQIIDPWGHQYRYKIQNRATFSISSLGADGKKGGIGSAMDLKANTTYEEIESSVKGWLSCF